VWASDISREALDVAARNVARHEVGDRVHLEYGDLMQPLIGSFDLICANLPYVARGSRLAREVVAQPAGALYAENEGVAVITRLLDEAPARLSHGGHLLAEVDPSVLSVLSESADRNFGGHRVHRDLGGHERVLEAWSTIPTNSEPSV
jgi:release factor glutamine methyltransferase